MQYSCGGVSQEVFSAAFGVGPTTKYGARPNASRFSGHAKGAHRKRSFVAAAASVDGDTLGVRGKTLRYGSDMSLTGMVNVRLSGEQLTASASYMIGGGMASFRFGGGF